MCKETTARIAGAVLEAMDRRADGLSRELACLLELGALSEEEAAALTLYLEELRRRLAHARFPDPAGLARAAHAAPDLAELSGVVELFADDLDLAFCRLGAAA